MSNLKDKNIQINNDTPRRKTNIKLLLELTTKTKVGNTPIVIPNNLKAMKECKKITSAALANELGVSSVVFNGVLNEKANLQVKVLNKIMNNMFDFKLSFDSIYSKQEKIKTIICTKTETKFFLFDLGEYNDKDNFLLKGVDDIIDPKSDNPSINFITHILYISSCIYKDNNLMALNDISKNSKPLNKIKDFYIFEKHLSELNLKSNHRYLFIKTNLMTLENLEIDLDLIKNTDIDAINFLNNVPWKRIDKSSISVSTIKDHTNYISLPEASNILTKDGAVKTDKLDKKYILNSNVIVKEKYLYYSVNETLDSYNKLKAYRIYKNIPREEMAKILEVSDSTYIQIENSTQSISTQVLWRIVYNFRVPLEAIFDIDIYLKQFK